MYKNYETDEDFHSMEIRTRVEKRRQRMQIFINIVETVSRDPRGVSLKQDFVFSQSGVLREKRERMNKQMNNNKAERIEERYHVRFITQFPIFLFNLSFPFLFYSLEN